MSATNVGNAVLEKRNRHMRMRMDGWRRIAVAGVVGAVALVALGDRGQTQVAPQGQDPLEILNLQVRANAIIVLDSSGSMGEDALINPALPNALSGDSRFSKMYGAKQVLSRVIAANENRVSFQFGRYTQPFAALTLDGTPLAGSAPGNPGRFHYNTTNVLSPGMTTGTIVDLRSYVVPALAIINIREPATSVDIAIPLAGRPLCHGRGARHPHPDPDGRCPVDPQHVHRHVSGHPSVRDRARDGHAIVQPPLDDEHRRPPHRARVQQRRRHRRRSPT